MRVNILCNITILDLDSVAEKFQSQIDLELILFPLGKTTVSTFLTKRTVKHEFRARDEFNI